MSWGEVKNVEKASEKQINYLCILLVELNGDINIPVDSLLKSEATKLIQETLNKLGDNHIHRGKEYYERRM